MRRDTVVRTTLAMLGAIILAGCGSQVAGTTAASSSASSPTPSTTSSDAPTAAVAPASSSTAPSSTQPGSYIDYATYSANKAAYATSKVVLFFHAPWCPSCRATEENLTADPAGIPAGLTIVKTDYDSSTDLKSTYGVTVQHTFVQIGSDGAMLAKWSGTLTAADIAGRLV
jgi:thioredoxin 1